MTKWAPLRESDLELGCTHREEHRNQEPACDSDRACTEEQAHPWQQHSPYEEGLCAEEE